MPLSPGGITPLKRTQKRETPPVKPVHRWGDAPVYATLVIAIAAIYGRAITFDFINYDDPVYVTDNPQIRAGLTREGFIWAFGSAHDSNWIPLTWLSHMLDCEFFGLNAGLLHLTS